MFLALSEDGAVLVPAEGISVALWLKSPGRTSDLQSSLFPELSIPPPPFPLP